MAPRRLDAGGALDRSRPLKATIDGRPVEGFDGDTLASAALASGSFRCGNSIYRDRPRGIASAGVEEPNAFVRIEGQHAESMLPATAVELADGLEAGWLRGIGVLDDSGRDESEYDKMHVHADVVVVGSGPAGLAAAREAASGGARVVLVEQDSRVGGDLLAARPDATIEGLTAAEWIAAVEAELEAAEECRVLVRTSLLGSYDSNYLVALERRDRHPRAGERGVSRQRLWHLTAQRVVLAAGALERPLVFAGNDLPGVMLAGAARSYARRYAIALADEAVVATTSDSGYETARALLETGASVTVVDSRADAGEQGRELEALGATVLAGSAVVRAEGADAVTGAVVAELGEDGLPTAGSERTIPCQLLAASGGWTPAVHLHSQRQGRTRWAPELAAFVPSEPVAGQAVAGAANGAFSTEAALEEGRIAGREAAEAAGFASTRADEALRLEQADPGLGGIRPLWLLSPLEDEAALDASFVDLHRDATAKDVLRAVGAGMRSVEHVKRYTSIGTGAEQGRTGGVNAVGVIAKALGGHAGAGDIDLGVVGTTTYRAPYTPVAFAALAGRSRGNLYDPIRRTPSHAWAEARGALFEDVGQWKRAWYFPQDGEDMDAAVARECRAAREGVAFMDATTLGKIEIRGADAGEFLNRMYTNAFKKLPEGKGRYGVMCKADGMVLDDGVTLRLDERTYFMTTTTGGAARVLEWLEEWAQTEWPELDVVMTSATEQYSTIAVVGPKSRDVMRKLLPGEDVSKESWGFMEFRQTTLASGIAARVCRITFSGELAFEINVPTWYGAAVWEQVAEAGEEFGITPYGTETMHVLRAEKAYPIVGQDTDGTVTPQDLGMDWIISKTKHYVGQRSHERIERVADQPRKQLVAVYPSDPTVRLPEGSQIVEAGIDLATAPKPVPMLGHVTSSYRSEALGRTFALALVRDGRNRIGETLQASFEGRSIDVDVVDAVTYDPEGARRDG